MITNFIFFEREFVFPTWGVQTNPSIDLPGQPSRSDLRTSRLDTGDRSAASLYPQNSRPTDRLVSLNMKN